MFKPKDKVVCVDAGHHKTITKGRNYVVVEVNARESGVVITNDCGKQSNYYLGRFELTKNVQAVIEVMY